MKNQKPKTKFMMKKTTWIKTVLLICFPVLLWGQSETTINLLNKVVFYDGYAAIVNEPVPTGVERVDNTRYVTKLSDADRLNIQSNLKVEVKIGALCDNYDRIGGVFLNMVPKGEAVLSENTQRLEIGRFITPFMNKNRQPTTVPYEFDVSHLAAAFKSTEFSTAYDFWFELFVFGVPYAANNEVAGCKGRSDVFEGTLNLVTSGDTIQTDEFYIEPIATYVDFNKYSATDVPGTTTKLYTITLDKTLAEANFHLITSNHGANNNGEEYVRRKHFVYLNDAEILNYTPGGKSCEPYRQYNTQGNGIYGTGTKSESWWTEWNNWCPGDVIPNRYIALGDLEAGTHTFKITVPDAVFAENQGNFPLSLYLYSKYKPGTLGIADIKETSYSIYPNPTSDLLYIESSKLLKNTRLINSLGQVVLESKEKEINMAELATGVYILKIEFSNGVQTTERIVKK